MDPVEYQVGSRERCESEPSRRGRGLAARFDLWVVVPCCKFSKFWKFCSRELEDGRWEMGRKMKANTKNGYQKIDKKSQFLKSLIITQ